MTSFNDILLNDLIHDLPSSNNSVNSDSLSNEYLTNSEPLFIIDENQPKDNIVNITNETHDIHYLDSSKIYNPKNTLGEYTLKMHQLTTLYYMTELEKMLYDVKTIKSNTAIEHTNHYTNIGILSDQVGAGKSYCIMALLNENKTLISKNLSLRNNNIGSSNITPKKIHNLNTNILLVPHSLIGQWSKYLEKSGLSYHTIQKTKDVYVIADDNCKFKDTIDDSYPIDEVENTKKKPVRKTVRKNVKTDNSLDKDNILDNTDIKSKKKIVLKKNKNKDMEKDATVEHVNEPIIEPIIDHAINIRKAKSDKKKQLEIDKREILAQMTTINSSINALYYDPNYRYLYNNSIERELICKKISDLKLLLPNLDNKYLEISNSIKNLELEYGSISSVQITLLNDYNTIFNDKNNKCYNPNYINKELKDFLANLSHINKSYVESLDLILVSDSFYNFFSIYLTKDNYTVNRIIIDECNSIKGSLLYNINTLFTWLVTSSINSLMTNTGFVYLQKPSPQGYVYNVREKTIMSTGFVLNTISRLYENRDNYKLYLINNPLYIKQSILLPEMQSFLIICKDNVIIQVLKGVVSEDIMKMLNAGDIEGIITKLDVVVGDESNIISIITQKYTDDLRIKEYELKVAIENPKYKPETESISINNKRTSIIDLKYKITCIEDRIKNSDNCPICIDELINPVITPCCNNKYCFNCITLCLNCKTQCPSCRNNLTISKLLVLSDKTINKDKIILNKDDKTIVLENLLKIKDYTEKLHYLKENAINFNKYENLDNIFNVNKDNTIKKYLIFTEYESTLNKKITSILDKWELKYDRIRGSSATINKQLEKYKNPNGETNILLVNSKFFGSGMNLENTTDIIIMHKMNGDIEMQAIGRAQRFGRVGNLRVWKLYYQNEST